MDMMGTWSLRRLVVAGRVWGQMVGVYSAVEVDA